VLEESNRRFHEILENVELVAMTLDRSGTVTFCNDFLLSLAGWRREEVIGHSWFDRFLPTSAADVKDIFFRSIETGDIPRHHRNRIKTKTGGLRMVAWNNTMLRDGAGQITGTASIGEDITNRERAEEALRESEAQFRQVVESIQEVFWMIDSDRKKVIYISPGYEKIWGRTCESLYNEPGSWAEAIHPEDRERVLQAAAQKQERGDYDETYRIRRPDGTVRWVRDRAYAVHDAQGRVRRVVGTAEDITEYRSLEEQYRHAQKLEAIGTMAGGIAHDFNNILTSIMCYTELAKYSCDPGSPSAENLEAVLDGAKRAADLVRQILAFGRHQEPKRQRVKLKAVIEEALKLLRAATPATIEFDVVMAADAPAVLADVSQVHQVVMNLGTNAVHAMRERPGRLSVRLSNLWVGEGLAASRPALRPGSYALLTVTDTGQGIDAATLPRIFEPFFTTKGAGEGTGLGLSTVHGIMRAHDGDIRVHSTPGHGATFELYFPAYMGKEDDEAAGPVRAHRGNGERILYVDDEQALALLGRKVLERLDYVVECHTSASAALEAFAARPAAYDLVVTDQLMPGMTGTALAQELHAARPDLPIILTTGFTAMLTDEKVRGLGIAKLIMKPLTVESLGACVHEVLSDSKAARGAEKP
jgi:PAS domain S-box-containing protein